MVFKRLTHAEWLAAGLLFMDSVYAAHRPAFITGSPLQKIGALHGPMSRGCQISHAYRRETHREGMIQRASMTVGKQEEEDEFIVTVSSYFRSIASYWFCSAKHDDITMTSGSMKTGLLIQ
jgi:hypothetical protein